MTYGNLKHLVRALLIGDNVLSKVDEEVIVMLDYAYDTVANEADAMKLFTEDATSYKIIREGPGNQFIRRPSLPVNDNDILDIDHELGFAVARIMCSFISREKIPIHLDEAKRIIRLYNEKVARYFEAQEQYEDYSSYVEYDQYGRRII